jgi:hypothetical protein
LLPVVASFEAAGPADLKNRCPRTWSLLGKLTSLAFARYQMAFFIGVAATLAWQSYGDAAKEGVASSYPQLGWLAPQPAPTASNARDLIAPAVPAATSPDQQQVKAMSLDLDAVRENIDRIAASQEQIAHGVDQLAAGKEQLTRSIDQIAASEEQMTRNIDRIAASEEQIAHGIDQLAASQEQMTREIIKLQEVRRSVVYKDSEPPPRPALVLARTPLPRSSPAPSAKSRGTAFESQAEPGSLQSAVPLDIKPTEASPPHTLPERGKQPLAANEQDFACFPSASAVLQNYPGILPSWTLRAPGHEGTRCWHAATRTMTRDHRSGTTSVGATENRFAAPPAPAD